MAKFRAPSSLWKQDEIFEWSFSMRTSRSGSGGASLRPRPPEPGVRLSSHPAQAAPKGSRAVEGAGLSAARRRQLVWIRRIPSSSAEPPTSVIACLVIALRVTANHCSHSWGLVGWWSALRRSPPHDAHRPPCALSWRMRLRSSGGSGPVLRRRLAQYPARIGSSSDAVPFTRSWRMIFVQPNRRR